MIAEDIAC